jgi:probable O-glycosylation ligase (exosortase A-associated)
MPFFVRERVHFHAMFIVIALGLGVHGVLNGLKTVASGGGHNMVGPAGTMLGDRNHLSTALALVLPVLFYLQTHTVNRLIRLGYLGAFCIVVLAILGGGSRAGFIAVSVVGLWLVLTARRKGMALMLVGGAVLAFLAFAPEDITSRLTTIKEAGEDSSFMGRVIAWKISSAIALENPVLVAGFMPSRSRRSGTDSKCPLACSVFWICPFRNFLPRQHTAFTLR